jgi:hypothetical protein
VAQTGSYTEAVADIKMAVIDKRHPEVKLDQAQAEIIQAKLVAAVHAHPVEETPLHLLNSKFMQGVLWITCVNEYSQTWLVRAISKLGELWGADVIAIDSLNLPKRPRMIIRIPDVSEVNTVLTRLRAQNRGLLTSDWVIMRRKNEGEGRRWPFPLIQTHTKLWSKPNSKPSGNGTDILLDPAG